MDGLFVEMVALAGGLWRALPRRDYVENGVFAAVAEQYGDHVSSAGLLNFESADVAPVLGEQLAAAYIALASFAAELAGPAVARGVQGRDALFRGDAGFVDPSGSDHAPKGCGRQSVAGGHAEAQLRAQRGAWVKPA